MLRLRKEVLSFGFWPRDSFFYDFLNRIKRKYLVFRLDRRLKSLHAISILKQVNVYGYKYQINLVCADKGLSRQLFLDDIREWRSTKFFVDNLLSNSFTHIVDLGSNLGYFLFLENAVISNSNPEQRFHIFGIEPSPTAYKRLEDAANLNGYQNIKLFNVAIGSVAQRLTFHEADSLNWSTLDPEIAKKLKNQGVQVRESEVEVLTLDSFIETNLKGLDSSTHILLRMDTESYEYQILSSSKLLSKYKFTLFLEFHTNLLGKAKSIRLLSHLKRSNFLNCTIIFNEKFTPNLQLLPYPKRKAKLMNRSYDINELIDVLSVIEEHAFYVMPGFELWVSN